MKIGAARHPKTEDLQERLGVGLKEAVGILELLWHFAAEYAPEGDVGRYADARILSAIDMAGNENAIPALIKSGWLEVEVGGGEGGGRRLVVHDWQDHCPDYVRKRLARKGIKLSGGQRRTTADNGGQRLPTTPRPTTANHGEPNHGAAAEPQPPAADGIELKAQTPEQRTVAVEVSDALVAAARSTLGLTPEAALTDLLGTFPEDWIRRAISVAIARSKVGVPYVRAILQRWKKDGRPDDDTSNAIGNSNAPGNRKSSCSYNAGVLSREPVDKFKGR